MMTESIKDETIWVWLGKKGWLSARGVSGPGFGCGSPLERSHTVRTADGKIRRSYCIQYRNPELKGKDKPPWRVWEKGETVWARLLGRGKGSGWIKARMYSTGWFGPSAPVYTGKARGNSCYLVGRIAGLRSRNTALAGRDMPQEGGKI